MVRTRERSTVLGAVLVALVTAAMSWSASAAAAAPATSDGQDHAGSGLAARTTERVAVPLAATAVRGLDVSGYQGNVNWSSVAAAGASFAYVKATEGVTYTSGYFGQQYNGSATAGLIRGAYHFARPDTSSAAAQADYFIDHGGTWRADGRTLPGALDIEYNPKGATCYGMSQSAMVNWIAAFSDRYRSRAGRAPVIYSTTDWWSQCTGDYAGFGATNPLWIANYSGTPLPLPHGWTSQTIWQYDDAGTFPGDQNTFNGTLADLRTFALGDYTPPPVRAWPLLRQGQTGRQVTTVQYLLNAHGATMDVDGDFGPATRTAVVSFQTSHGLETDGIVGPATWSALVTTVQAGDSGPAVRAVQAELVAHGVSVAVDGTFTDATSTAVIAFQNTSGLDPDGVVGLNTWQALVS
ncbi:GH25 family lysozyme [Actinophytocola sp.]|uniref:GH25 family lysozyme n=1 Tax=Actinophytocola sp. TaxID=1872138 RepID=UPI00389B28F7